MFSPCKAPVTVHEDALLVKRIDGLHAAISDWWPPTKRRRATQVGWSPPACERPMLGGFASVLAHCTSFGVQP